MYSYMPGTSTAAPFVTGAVALIRSRYPELTAPLVRDVIVKTADDLGAPGFDYYYGWGRLNMQIALWWDRILNKSFYPRMSAFNNSARVARFGNNVYVVFRKETQINYLKSTDGGVSFGPEQNIAESDYLTNPAICLSTNGTPYIVWGQYTRVSGRGGPQDPGWHLQYYVKWYTTGWNSRLIYDEILDNNPDNPPPDTLQYLVPPSFTVSADSGYVVFLKHCPNLSRVIRFSLANPGYSYEMPFIEIPYGVLYDRTPVIGYDRGDPNNLVDDRVVVVVRKWSYLIKLYFRRINTNQWDSLEVPNYSAFGSPSLWVGQNELRIAFEGWNNNNLQEGLFFLRIPYQNNTYNVNQPVELVSNNFDDGEELLGYTYLAGPNVVLWKYQDDIWYAQRQAGAWITLGNLSQSGGVSSYPQGLVFGSFLRQKLFALWTGIGDKQILPPRPRSVEFVASDFSRTKRFVHLIRHEIWWLDATKVN